MVFNSTDISTMPDANLFGDEGGRKTGIVSPENLGHERIAPLHGGSIPVVASDFYDKMWEALKGSDTACGHRKMMRIMTPQPFDVYPDNFSKEAIDILMKKNWQPHFRL